MKSLSLAILLGLLLAACSTPDLPESCTPGVNAAAQNPVASGGQRPEAKATTGDSRGVPNPLAIYGRGPVSGITHSFKPESRTAGTIANPKAWTADTNAISSAPMAAKCAAGLLEAYAVAYMDPMRTDDEKEKLRAAMADLVDKIGATQVEWVGAIAALAPKFTNCLMLNLDLSGSSAGAQDAVDPANAAAAAGPTKELLDKGLETLKANAADSSTGSSDGASTAPDNLPNPPAAPVNENGGD